MLHELFVLFLISFLPLPKHRCARSIMPIHTGRSGTGSAQGAFGEVNFTKKILSRTRGSLDGRNSFAMNVVTLRGRSIAV